MDDEFKQLAFEFDETLQLEQAGVGVFQRFHDIENFFRSIYGTNTPEFAVAERLWRNLPIPCLFMIDELLTKEPDKLLFCLLETINIVHDNQGIEAELQLLSADKSLTYALHNLQVNRRVKHHQVRTGGLLYGLLDNVQLSGDLCKIVKSVTEEQLYFLEILGHTIASESLIKGVSTLTSMAQAASS